MTVSRTRSARVVSPRRFGASVAAALALSLGVFTGAATAAAPDAATYQEPFRPQFHFTPGEELDERSERARLLQGRVPPLLPAQPVRGHVGPHVVGARGQP